MSSLHFTAEEIATLTEGYWENFNEKLLIKEFHHTYHYLKSDDAFVVISDNWPNKSAYKNNEAKIQRAIDNGVSAIIAENKLVIDTTIPILRVENTYYAMKKLAKKASQNTQAQKVLIVGSYGKTGFKAHLNHLIKEEISTYVRLNSANYTASNYCNLASIKQENKAFLMEMPVARKDRMQRRSKMIKPDICVLTSIGHEHIERFKSIKIIIENKVSIASSLNSGGKFLVNKDDKYFKEIMQELKKYKGISIKTFGQSSSNNASILYQKFRDFGWDIIAKVENKVIAYRVPFPEEYAPSNSLGVILCAYYLGVDIHKAVNNYYDAQNLKSSGLLYKASYQNKTFFLYDQSNRGGIEGYESFFKTLAYIRPKNKGRKFLVTSEFVDYEDGEMKFIDNKYFQLLIKNSGLEILYSVEKFAEHINVLEDRSIWKTHSLDFQKIKDEIINEIQNDDIVCIKGIFESNLPMFMQYIKKLEGMKLEVIKPSHKMEEKNNALSKLRTIEVSDIDDFKKYVNQEKRKGWIYYFPFIYFWSLSSSREVLIEKKDDSLNIFLLNSFHRSTYPKIQLYVPSLPLSSHNQAQAFNRVYQYKGYKTANIIWVDREDVLKLKQDYPTMTFKYKMSEYIYKPQIYNTLSGKKLKNLRHQLTNMSKNENIVIVDYEKKYEIECLELYEYWTSMQKAKYVSVSDEKYTKNCLKYFNDFSNNDLNGIVILQDNKVKSFGFFGEINEEVLNLFIAKSNHNINGIQSYLKYSVLMKNQEYLLVNDGPGISKGLGASKRMFRPVLMHKVYKARIE